MLLPAFLDLSVLLGIGIDVFNYTSTGGIVFNGAEHGIRENVSYENVRYVVTLDPTDVFPMMTVPSDLAIRVLEGMTRLESLRGTMFPLELLDFWRQPEVILAVSITRTLVVDKLPPTAPLFNRLHPSLRDSTHYVAEVGYGNQVLLMVGFRPSHPDDVPKVRAVLEHRLGGHEGHVGNNITEAMSLILRDLNDATEFRGPVFTHHKIFTRSEFRGNVNNLATLVPELRNFTLRHTVERERGNGAVTWMRLESLHKVNASFPRVERWTVLTEYKERMFRRLLSVFLDFKQARGDLGRLETNSELTEAQEERVMRLYAVELHLDKIRKLVQYGSIYGQTSADLKLLETAESYRFPSTFNFTRAVRRLWEEVEDLVPCYNRQDPNVPTRGLPRTVLEMPSNNITTMEGCRRVCSQDPKCRLVAVGAIATDPAHVRCWTFRHSVGQHAYLSPQEITPNSAFLSRECIARV